MKWTSTKKPAHWEIRQRSGFLWLPRTIQGETRWLMRATWGGHFWDPEGDSGRWVGHEWVDDCYVVTDTGRAMLKDGGEPSDEMMARIAAELPQDLKADDSI